MLQTTFCRNITMFLCRRSFQQTVTYLREVRIATLTQCAGVISRSEACRIPKSPRDNLCLRNSQQSRYLTHVPPITTLIHSATWSGGESGCLSTLVQYQPRRHAGHSKWQNIRHIKGAKDKQKQDFADKVTKQIRIAVRGQCY